jgi:hypothetical protein
MQNQPNQSLQPTRMLGTSAAEPPRVPSTLIESCYWKEELARIAKSLRRSKIHRDASRNWSDVYIVSDRVRNDCLWRIPVADMQRLFSIASQDYPHSIHKVYNKKTGDYDVSTN